MEGASTTKQVCFFIKVEADITFGQHRGGLDTSSLGPGVRWGVSWGRWRRGASGRGRYPRCPPRASLLLSPNWLSPFSPWASLSCWTKLPARVRKSAAASQAPSPQKGQKAIALLSLACLTLASPRACEDMGPVVGRCQWHSASSLHSPPGSC